MRLTTFAQQKTSGKITEYLDIIEDAVLIEKALWKNCFTFSLNRSANSPELSQKLIKPIADQHDS